MPPRKANRLWLTLFTTLVFAVAVAQGSAFHSPLERDHIIHGRFFRKRAPSPQGGPGGLLPVGGAAPSPSLPSEDTAAATSTDPSDLSSDALATTDAIATVTSSLDSSTTTESSTESSTSQTIDSTSVTPTAVAATEIAKVTLTSAVDAPAETAPPPPPKGSALAKKNTALTVIIVVAASVGGVAIIWTIFRKWKLRGSDKFDKRLQPADWQPERDDDNVPGLRRMNSGNGGSVHGHGSAHGSNQGLGPLPDHDFTAAAPVGGYADLARGPTYNPQMQQSTHHGPSFGRYEA